ncbi:hypothetical protein L345_07971, partial [Ophiophagus hannah]
MREGRERKKELSQTYDKSNGKLDPLPRNLQFAKKAQIGRKGVKLKACGPDSARGVLRSAPQGCPGNRKGQACGASASENRARGPRAALSKSIFVGRGFQEAYTTGTCNMSDIKLAMPPHHASHKPEVKHNPHVALNEIEFDTPAVDRGVQLMEENQLFLCSH